MPLKKLQAVQIKIVIPMEISETLNNDSEWHYV